MLTPEHLKTLQRPFSKADHEFIRGYVYLTEDAITTRIEEVDPSWRFELQRMDHSGDQCVVCARMTILDVAREGVGMQKVNEKAGEAEKGAATDALKRCARLFGVGRYLLNAPEQGQFDKWLAEQQKAQNAPQGAQNGQQHQSTTQPRQNAPASHSSGAMGGSVDSLTSGLGANVTPIEDAPNVYTATEMRVNKQGTSHVYVLKAGKVNITLFGGDLLRDAGVDVEAWKRGPSQWATLKPPLKVQADFVDEKWVVHSVANVAAS